MVTMVYELAMIMVYCGYSGICAGTDHGILWLPW